MDCGSLQNTRLLSPSALLQGDLFSCVALCSLGLSHPSCVSQLFPLFPVDSDHHSGKAGSTHKWPFLAVCPVQAIAVPTRGPRVSFPPPCTGGLPLRKCAHSTFLPSASPLCFAPGGQRAATWPELRGMRTEAAASPEVQPCDVRVFQREQHGP